MWSFTRALFLLPLGFLRYCLLTGLWFVLASEYGTDSRKVNRLQVSNSFLENSVVLRYCYPHEILYCIVYACMTYNITLLKAVWRRLQCKINHTNNIYVCTDGGIIHKHVGSRARTHIHTYMYMQSNGTRTFQGYRDLSSSRRITAGPSVSSVYLNTTALHSCFSAAAADQLETHTGDDRTEYRVSKRWQNTRCFCDNNYTASKIINALCPRLSPKDYDKINLTIRGWRG